MKALFIGRFQPFHKGHLFVVQYILKQYDEVILGIGSSQYSGTEQNPFSAEERTMMITKTFQQEGISSFDIVNIPDLHDPPQWVDHVCQLVPSFDVVFTNNEFTCQLFTEKGFTVKETPVHEPEHYCGQTIRHAIASGKSWNYLVPQAVAEYIQKIHGEERIQKIVQL